MCVCRLEETVRVPDQLKAEHIQPSSPAMNAPIFPPSKLAWRFRQRAAPGAASSHSPTYGVDTMDRGVPLISFPTAALHFWSLISKQTHMRS